MFRLIPIVKYLPIGCHFITVWCNLFNLKEVYYKVIFKYITKKELVFTSIMCILISGKT